MSLLFNMLSRFIIVFLPRSKHLLISWLQSQSPVIFEAQENKICHCYHFSPIYLQWSRGTWCHDLSFSLHSAIRVVSSAYLRLLIFLPEVLIPACDSSSPAFLIMFSAYKLNYLGDNIQPWLTPFPTWNQSIVPCSVLTVASWTCIQVSQEVGKVIWYSHLLEFSTVCCDPHSQKL